MARVYQAPTMGEAHVRAALVSARGMADLLVHRVGTWGQAHGDGLWYITRDKQEANVWVHFCSIGMSDVRIFFVDNYSEAGWQNASHRMRGRFGGTFG